jgi:hypothetical protein
LDGIAAGCFIVGCFPVGDTGRVLGTWTWSRKDREGLRLVCVLCFAAARGMEALLDCVYARATHAPQQLLLQHIAALIRGHLFAPA